MAGVFQIVEGESGRPPAPKVIDGHVVEDLKEPTGEAALFVVGGEMLEGARERFLGEIFRQRTILDHARGKIYGGPGIAVHEVAISRLRSSQRLAHQFSVTRGHWRRHWHSIRDDAGFGFGTWSGPRLPLQGVCRAEAGHGVSFWNMLRTS